MIALTCSCDSKFIVATALRRHAVGFFVSLFLSTGHDQENSYLPTGVVPST